MLLGQALNTSDYLASTNQNGYRASTYNGVSIKIYETNPKTQGVDVAVYTDGNKKTINNMTLSGLNDDQIKAKVNCAFMENRKSSGDAFYGFNYTRGNLYLMGKILRSTTDSELSVLNSDNQFYPSFCIRNDWSTAIRWPKHDDGTQNVNYCVPATVKACRTIIGSGHALVYEGKNVFTETVNDNQGYPIYISDYSTKDRFNHIIGEPFNTTTRTLFGQKKDNSFIMVVVESPGLTVKECAQLMLSLGCVNAVNFDGGGSSLMTVGSKKVTSSGLTSAYYGTAVMVYSKYGDVNDDGSTNAIDFGLMRQFLLGLNNTADNVRSDVNGDGFVNAIDFGFIKQYLQGIIQKFPADK